VRRGVDAQSHGGPDAQGHPRNDERDLHS
jgi:hypothetical protein